MSSDHQEEEHSQSVAYCKLIWSWNHLKDILTMRYFTYMENIELESYHHFNYLYTTSLDIVSSVNRKNQLCLFTAGVTAEYSYLMPPPRRWQLHVRVEVNEQRKACILGS